MGNGLDVWEVEEAIGEVFAVAIAAAAAAVVVRGDRLAAFVLRVALFEVVVVVVDVLGFAAAFAGSTSFAEGIAARATKVTISRSCCWC